MKTIQPGELFQHLSGFLSTRGIELKEGAYAKRIEQGCHVLTKAINVSQAGLEKAKTETGKKLDQVRQVIHEKTSPKVPPAAPASAAKPARKPRKKAAPPAKPQPEARRKPSQPTRSPKPAKTAKKKT